MELDFYTRLLIVSGVLLVAGVVLVIQQMMQVRKLRHLRLAMKQTQADRGTAYIRLNLRLRQANMPPDTILLCEYQRFDVNELKASCANLALEDLTALCDAYNAYVEAAVAHTMATRRYTRAKQLSGIAAYKQHMLDKSAE